MPKMDFKRFAKTAAGDPPELSLSILNGNGTGYIALPGSSARDGLVSVIQDARGSAWVDITSTAEITAHGSLLPGTDVGADNLLVLWYHFEG